MNKIIEQKWKGHPSFRIQKMRYHNTKDDYYLSITQVVIPYLFYKPSHKKLAEIQRVRRQAIPLYLKRARELVHGNPAYHKIFFDYVKLFHSYCRTKDFEKNLNEYLCM